MITTLLLPALEHVINRALRNDPNALIRLSRIKDQIIAIECTDWRLRFYLIPDVHGLQFYKAIPTKPDTTIKGTLNHFLNLAIRGANTDTLFHYPVDISGNTHNIEALREIFKKLDIDWEERLSHYLGDVVAHKLFFHLKQASRSGKNVAQKLQENTKEYLHFEARNLLTQKEANDFYQKISTLRDDVERLAARLQYV